jgi:hypothetical protein
MIRFLGALLIALVTVSCAHSNLAPAPMPVIHRIALIPATNPLSYKFQNAPTPLIGAPPLWSMIDNHSKAQRFNAAVDPSKAAMGDILTQVVEQHLREQGFEVQVIRDLVRSAKDPDDIDEEKLALTVDADAMVHVWVAEVGMYSGPFSMKYIPRVNLGGKMWVKNRDVNNLFWDEVDYGVDAKEGKPLEIVADERYRWGSFDELMSNIDEVRSAYATGTQLAAVRLADQISAAATASNAARPAAPTAKND